MNNTDPEKLREDTAVQHSGKPEGRVRQYLLAARVLMIVTLSATVIWNYIYYRDDPLWESYPSLDLLFLIFEAPVQVLFFAGLIGLFIKKRWAVKVVSLYGRISLGILMLWFFVDVVGWPVGIWPRSGESVYFIGSFLIALYLSSLDYISPVREYAGLKVHSTRKLALRAGAWLAFPAIIWSAYAVLVINLVPSEVRSLRTHPFTELEAKYTPPSDRRLYKWHEDYGFYLKENMNLIKPVNETGTHHWWKNEQGEATFLETEYVIPDGLLSSIGVDSPFAYEKALWNAGFFSGQMLFFKTIERRTGTHTVYLLETSDVNVIVHRGTLENGKWKTVGQLFLPDDSYIEVSSVAPGPNDSLAPVMMTIERYRKGREGKKN
jgi:hypothetical protein